ncbi:MAG: hypothetical protein HGA79_04890 [Anaerolineales bacterium]|nr:hypothetical protein [Anaerolineales bacterium]
MNIPFHRRMGLVFALAVLSVATVVMVTRAGASTNLEVQKTWVWRQTPYAIYFASGGYPYVTPYGLRVTWGGMNSEFLYAANLNSGLPYYPFADGIYRSSDNGLSWSYLQRADPTETLSILTAHPITPTILFAGFQRTYYQAGIYRSIDGGEHWISALPYFQITDIGFDPNNSSTIYASTQASAAPPDMSPGIYKSEDVGETWHKISDSIFSDIEVHPMSSTVLFAATCISPPAGIYRSDDSGVSWKLLPNIGGQCHIIIDHQNPNRMFAFGGPYAGIWKTEDGGNAWNRINSNLPDTGFGITILSAAIDPNDNNAVWVGLKYSGLFVSRDSGNTWNESNSGIPFFGGSIYGPQCESIALSGVGKAASVCSGRIYVQVELNQFVFLPLIVR